nr:hypothetical protein [Janthinobacterium sp. Marseille]
MQQTFMSYGSAQAVTPSDSTAINCRAIYVGGAGDVALKTSPTATVVTFKAPPVGTILPVMIDGGAIMAATTATLLIALA